MCSMQSTQTATAAFLLPVCTTTGSLLAQYRVVSELKEALQLGPLPEPEEEPEDEEPLREETPKTPDKSKSLLKGQFHSPGSEPIVEVEAAEEEYESEPEDNPLQVRMFDDQV